MEADHGQRNVTFVLALSLIIISSAVVLVGFWIDRSARSDGPEAPLFRYSEAVAGRDLQSALAQLAPEIRDRSKGFVEEQLGNRYTILASAVRGPSLLDRLLSGEATATRVTATIEVLELESNTPPWRATEEIPVVPSGGRWYLLKPPLRPE